jgi:hypothetical protein
MTAKSYLIATEDRTRCLIIGMPDGHTAEDLRRRVEHDRRFGPWFALTPEILDAFDATHEISGRPDYGSAPVTCGRCGAVLLPNPSGTAFDEWFLCSRCAA